LLLQQPINKIENNVRRRLLLAASVLASEERPFD
jgi:hypothetical protein